MIASVIYAAPGWQPGSAPSGTADPTSTPNPVDLVGAVVPALRDTLWSSTGAGLLVAVGVLALLKGWEWYRRMFRQPRQLELF